MKGGGDIQVGFSVVIERRDLDESSFNKSLLHLSRYGNRLFPGNLINALKGFWVTDIYTNDTDITKHLSTANTDTFRFLKNSV